MCRNGFYLDNPFAILRKQQPDQKLRHVHDNEILFFSFLSLLPKSKTWCGTFGRFSCTKRSVRFLPMKAINNPGNCASSSALLSKNSSGSSRALCLSILSKGPSAFSCIERSQVRPAVASAKAAPGNRVSHRCRQLRPQLLRRWKGRSQPHLTALRRPVFALGRGNTDYVSSRKNSLHGGTSAMGYSPQLVSEL
jgi:hypothetical protein